MRGFVFTVIFAALFSLLLLDAAFYMENRAAIRFSESNQSRVDRAGEIMDDISYDLISNLGTGMQSHPINATNKTNLTFTDTIPSTLASPGTELGEWASFVENSFAPAYNANITLNTTGFSARPRFLVAPYNLEYSYPSLSKDNITVNGSSSISNYTVTMELNRAINYTNGTNWTWSGTPTSLFIILDIRDSNGIQITVNSQSSGYLDPSSYNKVTLQGTPTGSLILEAGAIPGLNARSLRITPTLLSARTNTEVLLNGTPEITVYAPILAQVNEQQSSLILWEN